MIYEIKDYLIFHNIWFVILIKSIYSYTLKTKKTDRLEWLNYLHISKYLTKDLSDELNLNYMENYSFYIIILNSTEHPKFHFL